MLIVSGAIAGFVNYRRTGSLLGPGSLTAATMLLIILGIILLFLGVLIGFAWAKENRAIEAMVAEKDLLAHWTYSEGMSAQFAEVEMARMKWQLYLVKLPLIFIGFGALGWLGIKEYTLRMFLLSAGCGALIGLAIGSLSWVTAYFQTRQIRGKAPEDVYITKQGVLAGDTYHHWDTANQRLSSVTYESSEPAVLQFNYMIGTSAILGAISTATYMADVATDGQVGFKNNLSAESVRLPVPPGREQEGREIAAMFSEQIAQRK